MNETLGSMVDKGTEFEINGHRFTVLKINRKKIFPDSEAEQLRRDLLSYLTEGEGNFDPDTHYCVDFAKVDYCGISSVLDSLFSFSKRHNLVRDAPISLINLYEPLRATIEIAGLKREFDMYTNLDEYYSAQTQALTEFVD